MPAIPFDLRHDPRSLPRCLCKRATRRFSRPFSDTQQRQRSKCESQSSTNLDYTLGAPLGAWCHFALTIHYPIATLILGISSSRVRAFSRWLLGRSSGLESQMSVSSRKGVSPARCECREV